MFCGGVVLPIVHIWLAYESKDGRRECAQVLPLCQLHRLMFDEDYKASNHCCSMGLTNLTHGYCGVALVGFLLNVTTGNPCPPGLVECVVTESAIAGTHFLVVGYHKCKEGGSETRPSRRSNNTRPNHLYVALSMREEPSQQLPPSQMEMGHSRGEPEGEPESEPESARLNADPVLVVENGEPVLIMPDGSTVRLTFIQDLHQLPNAPGISSQGLQIQPPQAQMTTGPSASASG